jgi:LysM repeat protein
MSDRVATGSGRAGVCPFIALDDDRDFRLPVPDHRHRCFAENPSASRALAHQAAYCLGPAFPGCPTFTDWARREAAPIRDAPPSVEVRELRPASPDRGVPDRGVPDRRADAAAVAAELPPARSNWADPPPWAPPARPAGDLDPRSRPAPGAPGHSSRGERAVAEDVDPPVVRERDSARQVPDQASEGALWGPPPGAPNAMEAAPAAVRDLRSRDEWPVPVEAPAAPPSTRPAADAPRPFAGEPAAPGAGWSESAPVPRPPTGPERAGVGRRGPVGHAQVADPEPRTGRHPEGLRDPDAPSWERPRTLEDYGSLRPRSAGLPPLARIAALAVGVLVVVFALPFLLHAVLGGSGSTDSSPSAAVGASTKPTASPSATPVPAPTAHVYVVQKGDLLSKIAQRFGVTVEQILSANPKIKDPNKIKAGDQIIIPDAAPTTVIEEASPSDQPTSSDQASPSAAP